MVAVTLSSSNKTSEEKKESKDDSFIVQLESPTGESLWEGKVLESVVQNCQNFVLRVFTNVYDQTGIRAVLTDEQGKVLIQVKTFTAGEKTPQSGVKFTDVKGNTLFTCQGKENIAVTGAGGGHFGYLKKKGGKFGARPSEIEGLAKMAIKIESLDFESYYFDSNGFTIGFADQVCELDENITTLKFASCLDPHTKSLLIAASYYLNILSASEFQSTSDLCWFNNWKLPSMPMTVAILLLILFVYYIYCNQFAPGKNSGNYNQNGFDVTLVTWESLEKKFDDN